MGRKLLVFGGSGYVGGNIAKTAARNGWEVVCMCRQGKPKDVPKESSLSGWVHKVSWEPCDAFKREEIRQVFEAHPDAAAVVCAIGALSFSDNHGRRLNGDTNQNVAAVFYENPTVSRFAFISAARIWPMTYFMRGYYDGKGLVEDAVTTTLRDRGAVALRPGFIYGSRPLRKLLQFGVFVPLQLVGVPLEFLMRILYGLTGWATFSPPISVDAVAKATLQNCDPEAQCQSGAVLEYAEIQRFAREFDMKQHAATQSHADAKKEN